MDVIQLWWLSLGIAAIVVVVVAILLGLIIAAAKRIDRHAAAIWVVGKQIAGNTVSIWMLEEATHQLRAMRKSAESLEETTEAINSQLEALSGGRGGSA